jgi:monovalent cation/hydrogen antiporter
MQLPTVIDNVTGYSAGEVVGWGLLVTLVVVIVRLVWGFTVVYFVRALGRARLLQLRRSSPQERLVIGWAGMRGAVSLAAALALPLETDAGAAFPARDLIILLAYIVIVVTLVGQGLTLGPLIDRLGVADDGSEEREEIAARIRLAEAALSRVDELGAEDWTREDTLERVRGMYNYRRRRFAAREDGDGDEYEERTSAYQRVMRELYDAQREELLALRNSGDISDEVRRRVERELDLEESRLFS